MSNFYNYLESVGKMSQYTRYIHKSALDTLPDVVLLKVNEAAKLVPKSFKWNFVIIDPKYISFVNAENFDTTYEPVLGERYKIQNGKAEHIERVSKPMILHQRYKTVKSDYKGFDIEDDKAREKWYRTHLDAKGVRVPGLEYQWKELIKTLPKFKGK